MGKLYYVAYYRVSSKRQGTSHLGLDAQKASVLSFIKHNGNSICAEFVEVESGKRDDNRPELQKAIVMVKNNKATLIVAKLDRLSRNVSFIANLMESKVPFVCADLPEMNEFTCYIFAALAQQERTMISARTKASLQAAKARGQILGKPENFSSAGRIKGQETNARNARSQQSVRFAWHYIKPLLENGTTLRTIAAMLNEQGYKSRTGKLFYAKSVWNIVHRFAESIQETKRECK